jgi:DNA-binding transcriptional regulator YiaG
MPYISGPVWHSSPMTEQTDDLVDVVRWGRVRSMCANGEARAIRLRTGVSLLQVAEYCGTSHTSILRWERGQRVPHTEAALRYLDVLDALVKAVPA